MLYPDRHTVLIGKYNEAGIRVGKEYRATAMRVDSETDVVFGGYTIQGKPHMYLDVINVLTYEEHDNIPREWFEMKFGKMNNEQRMSKRLAELKT